MLVYLQRCGEHLNFATYSPGDPDRHACAIDKDPARRDPSPCGNGASPTRTRHGPPGTVPGAGMPGITRYRSRWPQEDNRYRVPGVRVGLLTERSARERAIARLPVPQGEQSPGCCPFGHSLWPGMAQVGWQPVHLHGGAGSGPAGPPHGHPWVSCNTCHDRLWQTTFYQPLHDINHHQPRDTAKSRSCSLEQL